MISFDVVGLGYSAVDYLAVVPYYPELDAKVQMLDFSRQGGGPVATAMVTAARLGVRSQYLGKVGNDDFGHFILDQFRAESVDTSRVVVSEGAQSRFSFIVVDKQSGKRTIIWSRVGMPALTADEVDLSYIPPAGILHLDGHEPDAALAAARLANETGVPVSLDAGSVHPGMDKLIDHVDVLIASEKFARDYTGETDQIRAVRKLFDGRRKVAGVTMGEQGCVFTDGSDEFDIPAFQVDVVDTTGAGDVFHGAFVYAMLQQWDLREKAQFASAVAAMKCTQLGGRAGIPTLAEALEFLRSVDQQE